MQKRALGTLIIATLALPQLAAAQTFTQVIALFNILIGLTFVAAFVVCGGGFIVYLCRLGNANREQGLDLMEWGVVILFVLVVILGIVRLAQRLFF